MKTSETEKIQSALSAHTHLLNQIEELKQCGQKYSNSIAALEQAVDLDDEEGLAMIGLGRIRLAILPGRITSKEQAAAESEAAILNACHEFIPAVLAPKISELRGKAETKVRAELKPHFAYPPALENAVASSEKVKEIEALSFRATISDTPKQGVLKYAEALLEVWDKVQAFAKTV